MSKNDFIVNGRLPAHPISVAFSMSGDIVDSSAQGESGLTKREYFASLAMQGLLIRFRAQIISCDDIAICARQQADALLKELEK